VAERLELHQPQQFVDAVEAMIERITPYGFDARIELALADGDAVVVQVTRERLELLELERGQIVWLRPDHARTFADATAV
jgi:hypothetical protein